MKVFIVLTVVIGCAWARSGPYLPSGWRPSGPAFYLPSEAATQKPSETPLKEELLQETEASSSDAFREYGPPKLDEVFLNIKQGLPDVVTEQAFFTEVKNEVMVVVEDADKAEDNTNEAAKIEANVQQVSEVSTVTESQEAEIVQAIEEQTTELCDTVTVAELLDAEHVEETTVPIQSEEVKINEDDATPAVVVVEESVVPNVGKEEIVVPLSQQALVQDHLPINAVDIKEGLIAEKELVQETLPTAALEEKVEVISVQELVQDILPTVTVEEKDDLLAEKDLDQDVLPTAAVIEKDDHLAEKQLEQDSLLTTEVVTTVTSVIEEEIIQDDLSKGVSEGTTPSVASAVVELEDTPTSVPLEVENKVADELDRVAQALVNLETEDMNTKAPSIGEVISTLTISGVSEQIPEGFVDKGPVGFAVYGPPKQEDSARLTVDEVNSGSAFDKKGGRRRRFSPKSRLARKH